MNTDIRIAVSFKGHRKRKRLKSLLGPGATDYLLDLWISTAQNHPSGILKGMDVIDISLEAGWDGDPAVFSKALHECGFMDKKQGTFVLHDWEDHQGYVVHAESRKDRARVAANKRWNNKVKLECQEDAKSIPNAMPLPAPAPAPAPDPAPDPNPDPKDKNIVQQEALNEGFIIWWKAYPKKQGKEKARVKWKSLAPNAELLAEMLIAVNQQKQTEQWKKENGQFIPMPITWLNQKRWEDEINTIKSPEELLNDRLKLLARNKKN